MLPRTLCHVKRRTLGQYNAFLLMRIGKPPSRCVQPAATPLISTFRILSTKNNDGSDIKSSSTHLDGVNANEKTVKEKSSPATPYSSTGRSIGASNRKSQQPESQKLSTPAVSSTIPSPQTLSVETQPTEPSASKTISGMPKDSATNRPLTPSSGEHSKTPPIKSERTLVGGSFEKYYDKVFKLWSERSGTTEILALKESVNEAGAAFDTASAAVTTNRRNLDEALRKWERASGQHLQLLQRRESWTPEDAQQFADFVSLEITSRAELEQARHELGRSEELLTKSQLDYINKMRRRYHEEQIWQDQWRVLGTYGTWTLIVLNSCVFLGSQFFQRRRERDRTETIERLIRESRSEEIRTQVQVVPTAHEASEMPAQVVATEDNNNHQNDVSTTEIEEDDVAKSEEKQESGGPTTTEQKEILEPECDEPSHPAVERLGAAVTSVGLVVRRWGSKLRSNTKELAGSINQKLHQALPSDIANDIPKSISEIHVPSAVIGASIGGIAALTISMIFSSFSNRRY